MQFSRLKSATVCAVSLDASPVPSAVVASLGGPVDALTAADGEVLGDGELLADGDALAFGLAAASGFAPSACPVPPDVVGVGEAFGLGDVLADDDGLDDALLDGVGVGVVVGVEVTVFVDSSSTWRKASCAVAPTSWPTCLAFLCGTETTMSSLPCCTTEAPLKPEPLIRSSMMDLALFIAPWSTLV